jgi:hypothetical protein
MPATHLDKMSTGKEQDTVGDDVDTCHRQLVSTDP